jgi:tetratricopeptide (TPR) repeat protein/tRNA A-37 threonylcarbamoyl transferase component Bud32
MRTAEPPWRRKSDGAETETLGDERTPLAPGAEEDAPLFAAGEVIGERYRIVRFIARGGAGEVYEAEDRELDSRVALKAIRRDHASDASLARFRREIRLARQVTHPNVCRIYDLGHLVRDGADVLFLTMELLEGETLSQRLHLGGAMLPGEALPLVVQMAAGLEAARKAGVVHRDFKSSNVMLVRVPEDGSERVVITDFGLAKSAGEDAGPRVTAHHLMVGTPAYMAPEQVEGASISPATDVYAFGVVLFEMLTTETPFDADTGIGTAVMRLKEAPPSPRVYVPDVDERWERVVLRCLERDPSRRFATAGEVAAALAGEGPLPPPPRRRRWLPAAAVLAAAALWALSSLWPEGTDPGTGAAPGVAGSLPEVRRSVALLGFKNLSGREASAWLSTALAEMLATEAAAGDRVRVVPGDDVERAKIELGVEEADQIGSELLVRIGGILSADLAVEGSYLVAGGSGGDQNIRLDLRIRDTAGGEVVATLSGRGTESGVLDLVEDVGRDLRDALDVGAITAAEEQAVRAAQPANPAAARLYARGLQKLRRYDARAARDLLEEAASKDPDNPLISSALASAWASLGYWPRAQEAARRAFDNSEGLGRRDRLWVEGRYLDVAGDRRKAASIFALLWDFFPDNLEYGLQLADAQTGVGLPEAAMETVAKLRALSAVTGGDPRVDLAEAEAARALSRFDLQQQRAARAADAAAVLGARLLVARAREVEAGAWRELGELDKALAAYQRARTIYAEANNRGAVARVLIAVAKIRRHQGSFDEARGLIEEALAVAREIGDQGSLKHALNTLAIILRQQGELAEARAMHEMELDANREIGDPRGLAVSLTSLGVVEEQMGDLAAARRRFEEALELGRGLGNLRSISINLNLLGRVLLRQGELDEARRHFAQALAMNDDTGSRRGRAYYLSSLADVDLAAGDLAAAREKVEEALEIRREVGEKTNVAYSLLDLAAIELEEGRPESAARHARAALAELAGQDTADAEALATSILASALLSMGRQAEAAAAAAEASALAADSEDRSVGLELAIRLAEVVEADGRGGEARRTLRQAVDEADRLGLVDLRLEAGLVLGRMEIRSGDPAAGRELLDEVAREAAGHGFGLVARKAEAAEG